MAGFRIEGNTSGNVAEVNAANQLTVALASATTPENVGAVRAFSEVDAGGITGTANLLSPETSEDYQLRISPNSILGQFQFNAAAQDTGLSTAVATTMTLGYGGQLATNASGITTLNTGVLWQSKQHFPIFAASETYAYLKLRWTGTWAVTNTTMEVAIGLKTLTTPFALLDGVSVRSNNTGVFGVSNVNGTEQATSPWVLSFGGGAFVPTMGTAYDVIISASSRAVVFWIDYQDGMGFQVAGRITLSASVRRPLYSGSAPLSVSHAIGGTAASGVIGMQVVEVVVTNDGLANTRSEPMTAALLTGGHQGQAGQTMGSTALYTNNLAAGAGAAMTNTTAALGTGMGGQFSALPTLAAGTDGIVCSYQNPLGTVAITGKQLAITGYSVKAVVTTVLVGNATPVIYAMSLCYGHTAVSLATAEAANAKAPRRVPLGVLTFAAAAAVGSVSETINIVFDRPIPVFPGEFVALAAKNLGAVTTTGVVTFFVTPSWGWVL
jgi:hypothetical protein